VIAAAGALPMRVLVAEDDEDHRFLAVRTLRTVEGLEVEVDAVVDGEEALDFVYRRGQFESKQRPHLILLDLKMPKVNGLEVLEQVKGDDGLSDIPVVVLTSSDRPEDIDAAYRLGVNCYVAKPVGGSGMVAGLRHIAEYWGKVAVVPGRAG
jgi:CheY-like chemotaxis protein